MGLFQYSIALIYTMTFLLEGHLCILSKEEKKTFLDGHNDARAQVKVAPISWDNKLESYAQDYANKGVPSCGLPEKKVPYGINIGVGYGFFSSWETIGEWVYEKNYYNYTSNSCAKGKSCVDYTQVVWRNSVRVGCANVTCGAGWPFYICMYDPRGNIPGQRPY